MSSHTMEHTARLRVFQARYGFDFVGLASVVRTPDPLLTWVHAVGNRSTRYRRIMLEPGKGLAGGAYQTGKPMVIQDAMRELSPAVNVEYPIALVEQLASMAAIPLWEGVEVEHILLLAFRTQNLLTEALYNQVMDELIADGFCGYIVHPCPFGQTRRPAPLPKEEQVPVYELMSYHILQAQEEERRRISRDLHDSVLQQLLGVQMLLRSAKYQEGREGLLEVVAQADRRLTQIQSELRDISSSLRPTTLDDLGLIAALRSHFTWVQSSHGVVVLFSENVGGDRFPLNVETVFYRTCQEALLNACKYASCDEITVNLTRARNYLTLEVTDHGVGFDPQHPEVLGTGLGLRGMVDRAELINGELTFQSAPGKGTSVWLTVKVKEASQ